MHTSLTRYPALRLRPLSTAASLRLSGPDGVRISLAAAVSSAQAQAEAAVGALKHEGASRGSAPTEAELTSMHEVLRRLERGEGDVEEGAAVLSQLGRRPAPSIELLKSTRAGVTVRRLRNHAHHTVVVLAGALMERWRDAADAQVCGHAASPRRLPHLTQRHIPHCNTRVIASRWSRLCPSLSLSQRPTHAALPHFHPAGARCQASGGTAAAGTILFCCLQGLLTAG